MKLPLTDVNGMQENSPFLEDRDLEEFRLNFLDTGAQNSSQWLDIHCRVHVKFQDCQKSYELASLTRQIP